MIEGQPDNNGETDQPAEVEEKPTNQEGDNEEPTSDAAPVEEMVRSDTPTSLNFINTSLKKDEKDGVKNDEGDKPTEVNNDGDETNPIKSTDEPMDGTSENPDEISKEPINNLEGMFEVLSSCHLLTYHISNIYI